MDLFKDDEKPLIGKVSPVACLGGRTPRATCSCCGGADGIRRAWRKLDRHSEAVSPRDRPTKGKKAKRKDKRRNTSRKYSFLLAQ